MHLTEITDSLRALFRRILAQNEVAGNAALAYVFSDPDGVRSGKSGWSFGLCQYDINNNTNAILALRDMNFTTDEIRDLKAQTIQNMGPMNLKLASNKAIIDTWDTKQMNECLEWPLALCKEIHADFDRAETFLHIADYHNQINFSRGGKLYRWIQAQKTPITPQTFRAFKYTIPWGMTHKKDVDRRFNLIQKLTGGVNA